MGRSQRAVAGLVAGLAQFQRLGALEVANPVLPLRDRISFAWLAVALQEIGIGHDDGVWGDPRPHPGFRAAAALAHLATHHGQYHLAALHGLPAQEVVEFRRRQPFVLPGITPSWNHFLALRSPSLAPGV